MPDPAKLNLHLIAYPTVHGHCRSMSVVFSSEASCHKPNVQTLSGYTTESSSTTGKIQRLKS